MKYNYLRMMLLGMLVMLCGTSFAEDKTETIDLVGNAWDNITVTAGGTSSTGGNMNISQGDIVVTSGLGYAKKGEMSIYKNGSLTIALSENVTGYITKVVLTLTNSYNFDEPGGDWTSDYSTPGTSAKVAKGETETFTTTATDKTSLTLNNNAGGKTGISKIYVEYVSASTSTLLTPTMSFSETEFTVSEGDAFTPPTLNYDGDGAITYSSSAPNVASVDEATGVVEIVSAGTASIIATAAKTDTYKSATASYNITVNLSTAGLTLPWTEDWSKYAVNEVPSKKNYNYSEDNGGGTTKIYNDANAGGTAPELLVAKSNGSFTASNISLASLEGKAAKLILTYHTNQGGMSVSTTVEGVVIADAVKDETDEKLYTREITVPTNTATLDITFMMTSASNGRIDDISLTLGEIINDEEVGFRDIKADLTQLQALATESNVYISVAEDGTISQTDDAENAAATLKGKWHSTSYGWSNFTASVPVEGTVKITYATHDYGNDITVTNAEGTEVAKLNTMGAKWSSNHDNVVSTYYRVNEPTTLHFSNANYNPYFAVEAIDPADIPAEVTNYNISFAAGEGSGNAPKAFEVEAGSKYTAPKNYTLYKEGYTLTGWNDGTQTYTVGTEITPESDMTLTAVFTQNEMNLSDRTEAVTISFDLGGYNDNPKYNIQGKTDIIVTQATVNGKSIDVKVDVNATSGKFAHNGSGWHQVNNGTKVTVPSAKGATIAVTTYNDATSVTFNGEQGTADGNTAIYTATSENTTAEIAQVSNNYWNALTITLPVVEGGDEPIAQDITATWDFVNNCAQLSPKADGGAYTAETMASNVEGIEMTIVYNGGQIKNNDNSYQVGKGVEMRIPVKNKGDLVSVFGYPGYFSYSVGGKDATEKDTEYKATTADAEKGYVSVVSTSGSNYINAISVTQYAPKEATTLDNEAVTATFPFNLGTDGQTATFGDDADYFLSSKVVYGDNLSIVGTKTPKEMADMVQTAFQPAAKESAAAESNDISFLIIPKPGFAFTPTKVSFKATRYGTNGSAVDVSWLNPDNSSVSLATGKIPNRNDGTNPKEGETDAKYSEYSFDITGATVAEGQCGLKLNLYSLDNNKQVGFCDIIIEGTLSGTEKDLPILASFKMNGTEYAADDVFEADGADFVGTVELSKSAAMVSESNPLIDITAASGEIGTVTYESTETSCKVTIPMTAGSTAINYILNIVQKPDFTLTYYGLDGTAIGTQTVEKDAAIGTFAVDIESVTGAQEGYKARGWFKQNYVGAKYKTSDAVTGNINLYAVETEIEVSSDSKKYTFDLTDVNFDDADHEGFNSVGSGKWHDNQHGWEFNNGDKIELLVGKKATVTLSLCKYSKDNPINASNGATIESDLVETDGGMQSIEYEGEAGTLTLTFNGTAYLHGITVLNTSSVNYIREGNTFTVFAGDASSFLDALDAANGVPAGDEVIINLPNGTYDLEQRALTKIGRDKITIKGESQDGVVIKNRPTAEGIGVTATLLNTSKYLMLENLTLKNDYPYYDPNTGKASADAGRAVCLQDKGNYTVCKNVTLLSYQDTYYSNNNNGQFYFVDCEIHGLVDYVCGGGDVFFDNVLFYNESRELTEGKGDVTIAAPNGAKQYGYVMQNCTVDTHSAGFNFGRSWGSPSYLRWLNTTLKQPSKLASTRFTVAGMNSAADGFYEYNTMDESGKNISPASNVINFTHSTGNKQYETIIDATEAANYTKEKVFEDAPELFKERIGYGTDGINAINAATNQQESNGIFNIAGQRVNNSFKGIVIINGKKYVK